VSQKVTEVSMLQIVLKKISYYTWKEKCQVFRYRCKIKKNTRIVDVELKTDLCITTYDMINEF
jgi:hypothetical protein